MLSFTKKIALQLTVFLTLLVALCLPNGVAAEVVLKLSATDSGNAGQLVLDWGKKQSYSAELEGGYLYVRFTRPFTADFTGVSEILAAYVGPGEVLEGKQSFRFPVKNNFELKTKTTGTKIILELLKKDKATSGQRVKVRSGEHAEFTRIVFDWPSKLVDYSTKMNGSDLIISFDTSAQIDINRINQTPPAMVKSIEANTEDHKTIVTIALVPGSVMSGFKNGKSAVFDIRTGEKQEAAEKKPGVKTEDVSSTLAIAPATTPAIAPVNEQPMAPKEEIVAGPANLVPETEVSTVPVALQKESLENTGQEEIASAELGEIAPASGSAIAAIGPTIVMEGPAVPRQEKILETTPKKSVLNGAPRTEPKAVKMSVKIANLKDGFRLIFPWEKTVAMAMFEHDGAHWVVFDQASSADFSSLAGPYKFLVKQSAQLAHDEGTVLRFKFREGYTPKISKANEDWHIDFQLDTKAVVENALEVQSQPPSVAGPRLFIPAMKNGNEIKYFHEPSEKQLSIIPLKVPGWGFVEERNFQQINLLSTIQGIALFSDDGNLVVASEQNGVAVSVKQEPGKLDKILVEKPKTKLALDANPTPNFHKAQFVKLAEWRQVNPVLFTNRKQELQKQVALAKPAEKLDSLMSLAKFYVGHGFNADAVGVLAELKKRYKKIEKNREFRLLVGLSNLGLHHLKSAKYNLYHPDFDGDVEVAPWRGVLSAELGDWAQAARELNYGAGAFAVYDVPLQNRFNLLRAEAALENFDTDLAGKILALVSKPAPKSQASQKALLQGIAALQLSNLSAASKKFAQAVKLGYRPVAERARFAKINGDLEAKEISPNDAIKGLEKLDFAWRGDDLEVDIQKRLGDLYVATGQVGNGLDTYKRIVRNFPKSPYSKDLGRKMNDIFAHLFLEGGADELSPIKALAIYYQYRELTPVGGKGDKMIRILADRLARVDLLEQSAQLLEHQINFRLKGEEKANAGTKLAVIHLWNNKPKDSLRVLYETRWRQLPMPAKKERRYIEARAQAGLQNNKEALGLLASDNSDEANSLRAEIHWKSKNWAEAIPAIERLIGNSSSTKMVDLDRLDRQRIMQLAVARSLSNDKRGIRKMRQAFRPKMEGTSDLAAFDLITEENDPSASEFRERATVIARVSQLESFMAGYREKLNNGEFWATY